MTDFLESVNEAHSKAKGRPCDCWICTKWRKWAKENKDA